MAGAYKHFQGVHKPLKDLKKGLAVRKSAYSCRTSQQLPAQLKIEGYAKYPRLY